MQCGSWWKSLERPLVSASGAGPEALRSARWAVWERSWAWGRNPQGQAGAHTPAHHLQSWWHRWSSEEISLHRRATPMQPRTWRSCRRRRVGAIAAPTHQMSLHACASHEGCYLPPAFQSHIIKTQNYAWEKILENVAPCNYTDRVANHHNFPARWIDVSAPRGWLGRLNKIMHMITPYLV